jgi:hypothetical protein
MLGSGPSRVSIARSAFGSEVRRDADWENPHERCESLQLMISDLSKAHFLRLVCNGFVEIARQELPMLALS